MMKGGRRFVLTSDSEQSYLFSQPPPPPPPSGSLNLDEKVSPSILLIIIIVAIIFFVSGLLHLLVRCLMRSSRSRSRTAQDSDNVTALQGQLQQLFHLHDSGVDQSFIDTLPVFNYKAIIGLKNPFDCAVCLCEFEGEDKLRLLPKCSHAFHMDCIDTWLLSHSTCPLCRDTLLPDFSPNNNNNTASSCPILLLESETETETTQTQSLPLATAAAAAARTNSHLGSCRRDIESGFCEIALKNTNSDSGKEKVVPVKLGKFRNVDGGESSNNTALDATARRCFSMGSFEYVMDPNSLLRVPIRTPVNNKNKKKKKTQSTKKRSFPLAPGHRPAISECDCGSMRELDGFEAGGGDNNDDGKAIVRSKKESFSISKIWLRGGNKQSFPEGPCSSGRAFSFRFPNVKNNNSIEDCPSEIGFVRSEDEIEEETQSNNNATSATLELDSQLKTPSFARRTLLWLVGNTTQSKVVHLPNHA